MSTCAIAPPALAAFSQRRGGRASVAQAAAPLPAGRPRLQAEQRRRVRPALRSSQQRLCCTPTASAAGVADQLSPQSPPAVETKYWTWRGYKVRYQQACAKGAESGPAMLCIHGFGGNCDHWRKNLPVLAEHGPVFAIDLLGFGFSEKPDPRVLPPGSIYNFENWGQQCADFAKEVIGQPAFLLTNSVGGLAGLQAAVNHPEEVRGVVLLDISLRGLHVTKQPAPFRPLIKAFQTFLRETPAGLAFFGQVAQPRAVKNVLREAYHDKETVTDELVDCILKPGLQPGAAQVFLDFISYSSGPLPEDLLPQLSREKCPVLIAWGEKDPWEPINEGRRLYGGQPCVEDFIVLKDVGHCPMDERPELVNPILIDYVKRHSAAAK